MWIYIITWCLINYVSVECDCNKPYKDEFGRIKQNNYAVDCVEITTTCGHEYKTLNRDSAFIFFTKGKNEETNRPFNTIDSVKIDSIKIN